MCASFTTSSIDKARRTDNGARIGEFLAGKGTSLALASFVLLLAFFLRIYLLGDKSVWWDEAISAWTARKSPLDIILYQAGSVHPPLHYLILHFWSKLAGESEFALRYLSMLLGVASVAVLYRLGRNFFGAFAALAAALLLTVSRFHVWWSQEIRMYSLAVLLGIASMYFLFSALRDDKWKAWVLYAVTSIAALYTLYLNTLTIAAQNVLVVLMLLVPLLGRRKTLVWLVRWALVQAAILAAYFPWLYLMATRADARPPSDEPTLGFALFWQVYATVVSLGIDVNVGDYAYLLPLPLLLAALGIAGAVWDHRRRYLGIALLLYLTIAPALIYALSLPSFVFYTPFVHARYFLYLVPAFLLALAWGLALLGRRWTLLGPALLAVFAGIFLYLTTGYYEKRFLEDDFQAMAATIDAYAEPSDAIILYPDTDWPIFLYHYRGDLPWYPIPLAATITPAWADETLSPLLDKHRGLWLVSSIKSMDNDPDHHVSQWFSDNAQPLLDQEYFETRLTLYTGRDSQSQLGLQSLKTSPVHDLREPLPDGISLLGYDQWLSRAPSGGTVRIAVYWQDSDSRRYDYSIALIDSAGATLVRHDIRRTQKPAPGQPTREQIALVIPNSAPSGTYRWQLKASRRGRMRDTRTFEFGKLDVVQGQQVSGAAPGLQSLNIQHPRRIEFGEDVVLLGYDVQPSVAQKLKPGENVDITLYWQRQQQVLTSYTVFVHLLGDSTNPRRNNSIWGQKDSLPVDGQAPTTSWGESDTIVDRYEVQLDADAPPGSYIIEIGMYQRANGKRLDVFEGGEQVGDRAILAELDVE